MLQDARFAVELSVTRLELESLEPMLRPHPRNFILQPLIQYSIPLLRRRHSHPKEPSLRLNDTDLVNTFLQRLHLKRALDIGEERSSNLIGDSNRLCEIGSLGLC